MRVVRLAVGRSAARIAFSWRPAKPLSSASKQSQANPSAFKQAQAIQANDNDNDNDNAKANVNAKANDSASAKDNAKALVARGATGAWRLLAADVPKGYTAASRTHFLFPIAQKMRSICPDLVINGGAR